MPFLKRSDMKERALVPGFRARFAHGEQITVGQVRIEAGAALPQHAHPHEQISTLVKGQFEFTLGGETMLLKAGSVVVIPPNVPHSARALTECLVIDAFHPVREDYR